MHECRHEEAARTPKRAIVDIAGTVIVSEHEAEKKKPAGGENGSFSARYEAERIRKYARRM